MKVFLVVIVLMLAVPTSASAAFGYGALFDKAALAAQQFDTTGKQLYWDNDVCAYEETAIADLPLQVQVSEWTQFNTKGQCTLARDEPAGDVGLRWYLDKWNFIIWQECRHSSWKYNSSSTSFMERHKQWADSKPCGAGKYRVRGLVKVFINGTWRKNTQYAGIIDIN